MRWLTFLDLEKRELRNATIQNLAVAPTSPVKGQIFYNSSVNSIWAYNGSTWDDMGGDIRDVVKATGSPISVIVGSNGVATIDIAAVTALANGIMLASDKVKLDAATSNATSNTLVLRDASGNFFANVINATKVTGLATGVNPSDAVNKAQLDLAVQGLEGKESVRAATIANIALTGEQTIDGIACITGDRILVKNQSTALTNGIYIVAAGTWLRAADMTSGSARGAYVFVEEGTSQADTGWLCSADRGADTINTNNLPWTQFSSAGTLLGGAGMVRNGNTFDIVAADSSIIVNSDSIGVRVDGVTLIVTATGISVKDASITAAKLAAGLTDATMVGGAGIPLGVKNYTSVTGTTISRVFSQTVTVGGGTGVMVTHNLNTRAVNVSIFDAVTWEMVQADVTVALNSVSITAYGTSLSVLVSIQG